MTSHNDATSWAVVLMAATSVVLMICLYQIDNIVHGTLYNYGLQFSYNWAGPYWKMTQLGFAVGWLNIIIAFAVQLNNIRIEHKAEQPATANEKAQKTEKRQKQEESQGKPPENAKKPDLPEEAPKAGPEDKEQEKKEESQQPEETSEKEPHLPETKPDEIPILSDPFQELLSA